MISERRRFAMSNLLMLTSLVVLAFTITATFGTDCARAAGGSCAVGDTEVFAGDLGLEGNVEFEGSSADDFETTLTVTDPTADQTITFPDNTGTVALLSDLSAGDFHVDQWRLDTAVSGNHDPIASNWERNDTAGFSKIGDGMTESSGVFTFPAAGVWSVRIFMQFSVNGAADYDATMSIKSTIDNGSNWVDASKCSVNADNAWSWQSSCSTETIFDVDDVSTHKVAFKTSNFDFTYMNGQNYYGQAGGDTNQNRTHAVFEYIGAN